MTDYQRSSGPFQADTQKFPDHGLIAQDLLRSLEGPNGIEVKPAALQNGAFKTDSVHVRFSGQAVKSIKTGGLS